MIVRNPLKQNRLGGMAVLAAAILAGTTSVQAEDLEAWIRVNDAPVSGRFTLVASFLDSLDTVVKPPPGVEGRVLYVRCFDPSGGAAFFIPGDLQLSNRENVPYENRFLPLHSEQVGGKVNTGETRAALWWVANHVEVGDGKEFAWASPRDLKLHYGRFTSDFHPQQQEERRYATMAAVRWKEAAAADLTQAASVKVVQWQPDPSAYEYAPKLIKSVQPRYPTEVRTYDAVGTVHVVARVDTTGGVFDAFVVQSGAAHILNASALMSVMQYKFRPAYKNDRPVIGEVVIPIEFKNQPND